MPAARAGLPVLPGDEHERLAVGAVAGGRVDQAERVPMMAACQGSS